MGYYGHPRYFRVAEPFLQSATENPDMRKSGRIDTHVEQLLRHAFCGGAEACLDKYLERAGQYAYIIWHAALCSANTTA